MRAYFNVIILMMSIRLFSFEINCPYGCSEPGYDYSITEIGEEFKNCLKEINLLKRTNVPWFNPDYIVHTSFLAENYEKLYPQKGEIYWDFECDAYDEDQCEYYEFSRDRFENGKNVGNSFDFSNFNEYLETFKDLQDDIYFMYLAEREYYEERIRDLKLELNFLKKRTYIDYDDPYFGVSNEELNRDFLEEIKENIKDIHEVENWYNNKLNISYKYQGKIEKIYENIFDWCVQNHGWLGSYYQRGLLNFNNGNVFEALNDIQQIIEKSDNFEELESQIFLLKGQSELELGLYHDAILTLSEAIKKDSKNKDIYIDRAQAYFELGKFDLAIKDYVLSDLKITPIDEKNVSSIDFSKGLIFGIIKGGKDGAEEFVPSTLASLHGLGNGLWALASNPIECSKEMILACQNCIKYVKENTSIDLIKELVPELKTLISNWNKTNEEQKGELTGYVIGKYGIDILMTCGSANAIKYYRDLRKANAALTLEKSAKSFKNSEIILKEASQRYSQREAILKRANLKIQWDKQGKHLEKHINYIEGKSILTHKDPQKLINIHAGTGRKMGKTNPGMAGYKELINFEEEIGYYVKPQSTERISTSWGCVHYAKDGVHIVPEIPR
jgi:hypothetical protein